MSRFLSFPGSLVEKESWARAGWVVSKHSIHHKGCTLKIHLPSALTSGPQFSGPLFFFFN